MFPLIDNDSIDYSTECIITYYFLFLFSCLLVLMLFTSTNKPRRTIHFFFYLFIVVIFSWCIFILPPPNKNTTTTMYYWMQNFPRVAFLHPLLILRSLSPHGTSKTPMKAITTFWQVKLIAWYAREILRTGYGPGLKFDFRRLHFDGHLKQIRRH